MVIGIEAQRANSVQKTGVEHYAKQLILHLAQIDRQNYYILYLRSQPQDWLLALPDNFELRVMPFPIFWTQIRISLELLIRPPDILFIPASSMPLVHPKKTIVTVHDLAFLYYPETYTFKQNLLHRFEDWLVKRFAYKIIAVSEATKKDFIKEYKVDPKKVNVVLHGYEVVGGGQMAKPQNVPDKYFLFLGTIQPRKNILGLLEAFKIFQNQNPHANVSLVVAGKIGWRASETLRQLQQKNVIYLGPVSDELRWPLYSNALAYILPSFYEGFGLPLLEAFASGVPVLTSNVSSLPEVCGGAGLLFDPTNPTDIAKKMTDIFQNSNLRAELINKGTLRLKEFSWQKAARGTLKVLLS